MSAFIIFIKTMPFALWGIFIFYRMPERSSPSFSAYPFITMMLAFLLFVGGKPLWQVDISANPYLAEVKALVSGVLSPASHEFTPAALVMGHYAYPDEPLAAAILISAVLVVTSYLIYLTAAEFSAPLSGLFAQYLFLLSVNYYSQENLYHPMIIALPLSVLSLYLFFNALGRNSNFLLGLCGLCLGIAAAIFPMSAVFTLSCLIMLGYQGFDKGKNIFLLISLSFVTYGILNGLASFLYPQAFLSGWRFSFNVGEFITGLQNFIWFDKLLIAILSAALYERFRERDLLLTYCGVSLLLLGLNCFFIFAPGINCLLLGLPLIIIPLADWWRRIALQFKTSLIFIIVLIISNLCLPYVDLF